MQECKDITFYSVLSDSKLVKLGFQSSTCIYIFCFSATETEASLNLKVSCMQGMGTELYYLVVLEGKECHHRKALMDSQCFNHKS